jgi:hypothetical protein
MSQNDDRRVSLYRTGELALSAFATSESTEPEVWIRRTAPGHYKVTYKPEVVLTVEVARPEG